MTIPGLVLSFVMRSEKLAPTTPYNEATETNRLFNMKR